MSRIHVLDENTINQIAAGEVVERPASVIKELLENAIDAGAKHIEVEITAGGTSFMRVTDDGCGMDRDDAALAVERHATSKIRKAEDLIAVSTLGFRGEALATIAAVSRFSLQTRREENELGTSIKMAGGEGKEQGEIGCRVGTTVKVEDLFFNTPARKKFMKTTHTEGQRINECVVRQALANPHIAFRFISNNKVSLSTPGSGDLAAAIRSVYGGQVAESLLSVTFCEDDLEIQGYLTKPSMLRSSRAWQTFIVNGRQIENKAMARALDNAYHSLLPKAGYPLAVLLLKAPQRSMDVNVHPRKTEIKFEDEGRIFRAVYKAVRDAIRPADQSLEEVAAVVPHLERHIVSVPLALATPLKGSSGSGVLDGTVHISKNYGAEPALASVGTKTDMEQFRSVQAALASEKKAEAPLRYDLPELPASGVAEPAAVPFEDSSRRISMTPIGQVALCYIVAKDEDTLYLVDQHAAHERILYDRFAAMTEAIPSQQLLVHLVLSFSAAEAELLERYQSLFFHLGFDLEGCGPEEFRLKAVPADIPVGEVEDILRKILGCLLEMHDVTAAEIRHSCLAMTACKAAIKRGDALNLRQMQIILDELSETARPYTCPHGRPTILRFTSSELAKMFKRT